MEPPVHGVATSAPQVTSIIEELQTRGFSHSEISVLFPDPCDAAGRDRGSVSRAPEAATAGGATGLAVGGALGFLAGFGALAIPEIGPLVVAGPLAAALSGAAVSGAIGAMIGGLVGLGQASRAGQRARRRACRASPREILISVHSRDRTARARARRVLLQSGARRVGS
jgi:hypothetical protein